MTAKEVQALESSRWGSVGLPCRREDEGEESGTPPAQAPEEECTPATVVPVARYLRDLECLTKLTSMSKPPWQPYSACLKSAFFVVGDARGKGKGNAVIKQYGLDYESGAWNLEWREKSSNCREAENLMDRLERLVARGSLLDHEVFLITDNSSFDGTYYKGHSPTRHLSEIVFRVHQAERDGGFILHVIHILGKRMKASGVYGLSRGDLTEGLMSGQDPLSFIPFHLGADERSRGLVGTWVQGWWLSKKGAEFGGFPLSTITKDNMFELRDLKAARLWMLSPAAMEVALELLCEDRLAHPHWPHVFVVPRLMTHLWRNDLMKNAGLLFTVPAQVPFWTAMQFEPLIVAIVLPLVHVPSYTGLWLVWGTHEGGELNRHFEEVSRTRARPMTQGNFMSWTGTCVKCGKIQRGGQGLFCSNFLLGRATFPPCRNVWCGECYREASGDCFLRLDDNGEGSDATDLEIEVSPTLNRYRCGRDGDHLMGVPFECDLCSFRNVCGRDQVFGNHRDQFTLTSNRQVQLDVMWAPKTHTVATNRARAKADYEIAMRQLSILPK
jgi:hypothetical protein